MDAEQALDELAEGGLGGPAGAANRLVESAWPLLSRRVAVFQRALGVSPTLWEDCGQEVLLRVWKGRAGYRGTSRGELLGWLFRICEREHLRLLEGRARGANRIRQLSDGEDDPDPDQDADGSGRVAGADAASAAVEQSDEQRALEDCIRALPPGPRRALELLYSLDAPSERQVAAVIGVSKSQVNVLRQKALTSVATCLRRKGVEG